MSRKAGENDQLFGSVTSADIAEALAAKGFPVDKRKIVLENRSKLWANIEIPVKLHREVIVNVKLTVERDAA